MSTIKTADDTSPGASEASPDDAVTSDVAARKDFMQRFGARCRAARGKLEVVEAAAAMGVHRNTISNIEKGASIPDVYDLERLARIYGTTAAALLDDGPQSTMSGVIGKSTEAIEIDDFVYVPLFDIKVSAGDGHAMFGDVEAVLKMWPFPQTYIRKDLGIWHNAIALVTVIGNSMDPDLNSRDVALLDRRDREVQSEGMHAVRLDNALLVKKLQRLPNRTLRVISSNSDYDPFEIQGSDDGDRDFEVLGRVRGGVVVFH